MTSWFWATTSSSVALLAGLLAAPSAWAGACCTGSTTTIPTRLGECESFLGGIGLVGQASVGRWDAHGKVASSSLGEQALITTFAAGWRWDRKGQIGLTAPVWLNHKAVAGDQAWGGGLGDLRVTATWDPLEEKWVEKGKFGWPVPVFTAGVRIPTGRDWERSKGELFEDVTGLGSPAALLGVTAERTMGDWPWSVGVDVEFGLDEDGFEPMMTAYAGVGRYLGTGWSLLASARHTRAWVGDPSARTVVGARIVRGQLMRWRAWAGVEADVPAPWLGQSAMRQVAVGGGVAIVR